MDVQVCNGNTYIDTYDPEFNGEELNREANALFSFVELKNTGAVSIHFVISSLDTAL